MAANYIEFNHLVDPGRSIARGLQMIREGIRTLTDARAIILQMRDGDGSDAAHYDLVASELGVQAGDYASANAAAQALFNEIDSLWFKLTTNSSVSDVAAAIAQAPAKLGI